MQLPPVRRPAVAGRFYPAKAEALSRDLNAYLGPEPPAEEMAHKALGCVVPHAGYMYSGHVAGAVYRRLPAHSSYIILCPNHFGQGAPLAMSSDTWVTPLGTVPVDRSLSQAVRQGCRLLADDSAAHAGEHSLEVQLPFLQHRVKEFSLVPIAVGVAGSSLAEGEGFNRIRIVKGVPNWIMELAASIHQPQVDLAREYAALESLGRGVARAVKQADKSVLIVASSDMNHYEPDSITRVKDRQAIDKILALDPEGLYDVVRRQDISMCGYGPTIAMLTAVKELGAKRGELVRYATSADSGGDRNAVVGYAGIIVS